MEDNTTQTQQPQTESNQQSPQPVTGQKQVISTPQQPVEPTPTPKKKKWVLPVVVGVSLLFLGAIGYFGYQGYVLKRNEQVVPPEHYPVEAKPTLVSPTPILQDGQRGESIAEIEEDKDKYLNWKTYNDSKKILVFKIPPRWQVSSRIIPKGTDTREYGINTESGDVEVISIQKDNDWTVRVTLQSDFKPKECGGLLGYTKDDYDNYIKRLKKIMFLGTNAYRLALENGKYWRVADQPSPYPQPILFEGYSYKITDQDNLYYGQILYNIAFCYENASIPVEISVDYFSDTFTEDNIVNKKIDYVVIKEMDKILEAIELNK